MNIKGKLVSITLALAVISLIGLFFSVLSLLDIYQNIEPDLTLEWGIVKISFLFFVLYVFISARTIWKLRGNKN
jgi:hypothetical protein